MRSGDRRRIGLPFGESRTVRVVARLQSGVSVDPNWPLLLDGLLSSMLRRRHGRHGVGDHHLDQDMPLSRWQKGCNSQWVWLATAARFDTVDTDVHWWHKRGVAQDAVRHGAKVSTAALDGKVGRYRQWRMPLQVVVASELCWWAVGDPARIEDLLGDVWSLGRQHNRGEGTVVEWTVTDEGEPDRDRVVWPDGRIGRPFPLRAAATLGIEGCETVLSAVRPPYWRPPRNHDSTRRQWREVIAPWTVRP